MVFEISFTPLQRRSIAIVFALIPITFIVWMAVSAVLATYDHHARVAELVRQRATYSQLIADFPLRKAEIAKISSFVNDNGIFRPPGSTSDIAAKIQSEIAGIITGAGAVPEQNAIEARAGADAPVLALRSTLAFTGDISAITRILYRLANARPRYFIERFEITDASEPLAREATLGAPHHLHVQLVVTSYMRPS